MNVGSRHEWKKRMRRNVWWSSSRGSSCLRESLEKSWLPLAKTWYYKLQNLHAGFLCNQHLVVK